MGARPEQAGTYLGLLRRPGEPEPLFTTREQGRMAAVLVSSLILIALGLVLPRTGHSGLGTAAGILGLVLLLGLNLTLRRVRRRRATTNPCSRET